MMWAQHALSAPELLDPSFITLSVMGAMVPQQHQETMKGPLIFLHLVQPVIR